MNALKSETLFLVDGSANIYRAYYAIRSLSTSKGFPTNAIYGFTAMLIKLFQDHHPVYLGMIYDSKGPTFRHDLYEEYKAHRIGMPDDLVMQLPYLKKIVAGFNVHSVECVGCEADDVIGTLTKQARSQGITVVIVSGDKDFCQLVAPHVTILDPRTSGVTGIKEVEEVFGVGPKHVVDVLGLAGDASDNIPGVPGIGRKTAAKLIQQFTTVENLYEHLDEVPSTSVRNKLVQGYESARISKELATIQADLPLAFDLEQFRVTGPDLSILEPLFRELEFTRFLHTFIPAGTAPPKTYSLIESQDDLNQLRERLIQSRSFAFVLDCTAGSPHQAAIRGLAISFMPHQAAYISLDPDSTTNPNFEIVKNLLQDEDQRKAGHDLKADCVTLQKHGIELKGIDADTMIASYLLNPSRRKHSLDDLAVEYLHEELADSSARLLTGKKRLTDQQSSKPAWQFFCQQADAVGHLAQILIPRLEQSHLKKLYDTIEMPLVRILAAMELTGVKIETSTLREISKELDILVQNLEQQIHSVAGEKFNINSPQQLAAILFDKLKLPVGSKGKNGYSTSVDVLMSLAHVHELPSLILEYRRFAKLKSTYIDVLPNLIDPRTGRIHTTFNQTITATGRLSSSDPNLQNIPIRGEWGRKIRQAFVADRGKQLVSADYSQIELRIMGHLSQDGNLKEAFLQDQDIHTRTAAALFKVDQQNVTLAMRRQAKVVNFGVLYGMSHVGLAQELAISRAEAKHYIDTYFERHQGVKEYIDRVLHQARERGYVVTLSGRIRFVPEINSRNRAVREAAERIAVNTPIQGTAADIIKIAMINIDRRLHEEQLAGSLILQIHDELVFEVAESDMQPLMTVVREEMEGAVTLDVPVRASIKSGTNWDEAH